MASASQQQRAPMCKVTKKFCSLILRSYLLKEMPILEKHDLQYIFGWLLVLKLHGAPPTTSNYFLSALSCMRRPVQPVQAFFFGEPFLSDDLVEVLVWVLVLAMLTTTEVAVSRNKSLVMNIFFWWKEKLFDVLECKWDLIFMMDCEKKKLVLTIGFTGLDHCG